MPEMFYGPWRLTFKKSDASRRNRLVVVGSDTADGTYERVFGGGPVELDVSGEAWSVEIESSPRDADAWEASIRERKTEYDPNDGIVITLHGYLGDREDVIQPNVVRCVYRDPDRNPPQVPDPFDFTYGRG
jgi:hypothetical protein